MELKYLIISLICFIFAVVNDVNSEELSEYLIGTGKTVENEIEHCAAIKSYPCQFARQGVAVDKKYFYAIDSRAVGKYDKNTGALVNKWVGEDNWPVIHLDSGVVVDGKLYCAHSNYPASPMVSSVEVWNTDTMKHIESHGFGIAWGSLTWVDWYDNHWWGVFANYSRIFGSSQQPYGNSYWTTLIKFNDNWQFQEGFIFPEDLTEKIEPMSISGGSWGADGYLYVTGHDNPELYKVQLPEFGSELQLLNTISVANEGQGIAWDRNNPGTIYTIDKSKREVIVSICK
jgi:hypothetical protein